MQGHFERHDVIASLLEILDVAMVTVLIGVPFSFTPGKKGELDESVIASLIRQHFPLTPKDIIAHLDLRRPIFKKTAAYGHFGRSEPDFTWEKTDKTDELRKAAS